MDELADFLKKTLYFSTGILSLAAEETVKGLEELGEQVQRLADEAIQEGETRCQEFQQGIQDGWQQFSSQPSAHLRQRLLELVKGNLNTAERLVSQEKIKSPGMSEDWYWEKVIYDLERDYQR